MRVMSELIVRADKLLTYHRGSSTDIRSRATATALCVETLYRPIQ